MLVELAIGDSYGAGFEFASMDRVLKYNNIHEFQTHAKGEIGVGKYTDDTQMSLAIIELILSKKKMSKENFAKWFYYAFKRDPRKGYASKFFQILSDSTSPEDMLSRIINTSTRNGAMMRSVPLGIFSNTKFIMNIAEIQSAITHNSDEAIRSSQIIALASHYLMRGTSLDDLHGKLCRHVFDMTIDYEHVGWVECDATMTINAVMTALMRNRNMCGLLMDCVNFGGDVDSVAAVALGLASLSNEYDRRLPASLLNSLENGPFGLDYLKQIDSKFKL
jgi:ADP-ribosylglycohydrolase